MTSVLTLHLNRSVLCIQKDFDVLYGMSVDSTLEVGDDGKVARPNSISD